MAIALVQHKGTFGGSTSGAGTVTCTPAGTTTAGNFLIVTVVWFGSGTTVTVTDGHGDSLTARNKNASTASAGFEIQHFWRANITASASAITAHMSGSSSLVAVFISEWSGCLTSGSLDSGNTSTDAYATGTSTSPLSVSITPSVNNCLIYGHSFNAASTPTSAGGSYTRLDLDSSLNDANAYLIQTSAGATQAAFSISSSTWDATAIIVQPPAAGASAWGPQLSDQLNRIVQGN